MVEGEAGRDEDEEAARARMSGSVSLYEKMKAGLDVEVLAMMASLAAAPEPCADEDRERSARGRRGDSRR